MHYNRDTVGDKTDKVLPLCELYSNRADEIKLPRHFGIVINTVVKVKD